MIESEKDKQAPFLEYDFAYESVKGEIEHIISNAPGIIRQYTQHLLGAPGKHIRALSLLCCALNAENLIDPDAVKLAAAIEILHLATLVHDDVIDNADMRRGIPSLQKKFGKRTAVICGRDIASVAASAIIPLLLVECMETILVSKAGSFCRTAVMACWCSRAKPACQAW